MQSEKIISFSNPNVPRLSKEQREGIGLSLSGGGFRAALFHVGALRRLNELSIFHKIDTISSVSGGSILSAFLAVTVPFPLTAPIADWENIVSIPFRAFCAKNIRRKPLIEGLVLWGKNSRLLAEEYDKLLTNKRSLQSSNFSKPLLVL